MTKPPALTRRSPSRDCRRDTEQLPVDQELIASPMCVGLGGSVRRCAGSVRRRRGWRAGVEVAVNRLAAGLAVQVGPPPTAQSDEAVARQVGRRLLDLLVGRCVVLQDLFGVLAIELPHGLFVILPRRLLLPHDPPRLEHTHCRRVGSIVELSSRLEAVSSPAWRRANCCQRSSRSGKPSIL